MSTIRKNSTTKKLIIKALRFSFFFFLQNEGVSGNLTSNHHKNVRTPYGTLTITRWRIIDYLMEIWIYNKSFLIMYFVLHVQVKQS